MQYQDMSGIIKYAYIILIMNSMMGILPSEYRRSTVGDSSVSRSSLACLLVNFMNHLKPELKKLFLKR